jgi:molecular chaperone DnaJ
MAKDYYEMLGVSKDANKEEIKKAFRKMAHQYHPDKNKGDDSKFKELNEAYQVLSDDTKRAQYDRFGSNYQNAGGGFQGGFDPNGFGFDFSGFQGNAQGFDMGDIGDIFSDFFGGNMGRSQTKRGRDISTEISITFKESIFGVNRKILISKQSLCNSCKGSGGKTSSKKETCSKCNGKGQIRETKQSFFGAISTNRICESCDGSGETYKELCISCKGKGVEKREEEVNIAIPAGIQNGEMIRMTGLGESIKNGQSGDFYIKINVTPHPIFKRDGINLYMELPVKLSDALLGKEEKIETLDGPLSIKIPEGVPPNEILRVREKGVPNSRGKRGDLMIRIKISMPTKLSKKAKEMIEGLKDEGL